MTIEEFEKVNGMRATPVMVAIWNNALKTAGSGIKSYGDLYRGSSLKVAMTADACNAVCTRLEIHPPTIVQPAEGNLA